MELKEITHTGDIFKIQIESSIRSMVFWQPKYDIIILSIDSESAYLDEDTRKVYDDFIKQQDKTLIKTPFGSYIKPTSKEEWLPNMLVFLPYGIGMMTFEVTIYVKDSDSFIKSLPDKSQAKAALSNRIASLK